MVIASGEHYTKKPTRWYDLITRKVSVRDKRQPEEIAVDILTRAGVELVFD